MQRIRYGVYLVRHSITVIQGASQPPPHLHEFLPVYCIFKVATSAVIIFQLILQRDKSSSTKKILVIDTTLLNNLRTKLNPHF